MRVPSEWESTWLLGVHAGFDFSRQGKFSLRRSTGTQVWQPGDTGGAHVPGNRKPARGYPSARVSQVPLLTPGKGHSTSSNSDSDLDFPSLPLRS